MYRGDKDLRVGIELCRQFDIRYTLLIPNVASPADSKFFNTSHFPRDQLPELPEGMEVRYLKAHLIYLSKRNISLGGFFQLPSKHIRAIKELSPNLIYENPFTTLTPRSYMTYLAAKKLQIPVVYVDPGDIPPKSAIKRFLNNIEGKVVRYASRIITYNALGKERFMREYGYPGEWIVVIPKPVDIHQFTPGIGREETRERLRVGERLVVSYMGRLSNNKGCRYLIEAAKLLKYQGYENEFFFLFTGGNIIERDAVAIRALKEKYALQNVQFTGKVPHSEMNRFQSASDIIVYPDITNIPGFSTVLAESMAMGKAIILGGQGYEGATPIVDGYNGKIIEARNEQHIVKAIIELKEDEKKRELYGKRVREFAVSNMDWGIVTKEYFKIFKEVL